MDIQRSVKPGSEGSLSELVRLGFLDAFMDLLDLNDRGGVRKNAPFITLMMIIVRKNIRCDAMQEIDRCGREGIRRSYGLLI